MGREHELRRLDSGLAAALEGRPALFLMGGEAGVGKTRLAEEFLARAAASRATALVGGCVDVAEGGLPLGPFVEALRGHVNGLDDLGRGQVGGAELIRLLPGLGELPAEPAPALGASSQARLFELALGLLGRLAHERPLLLVLEDLHWSDRSTRDLFAFLVRNLRAERIVLVATYRSDELYRGHPLRPFLAELDRGRRITRLDLLPFTRAELAEHVEALLGAPPERALVDSVFERSQGNAFFAEELVSIESEGARRELPPMLRDILLVRIESRSAAARELLRVVAAGGGRVPERLLAAVSQLSEPERDEALREAVEHRLLVPTGGDVYAFRHALVREAVYLELLPGERNRLHAACGAALAEQPELAGSEDVSALLAHHWYAAHDLPRALAASAAAGRVAERRSGFAEARGHYERALELWSRVDDAEARTGLDLMALTLRAAEAANLAGDHGRGAALIRGALPDARDATAAGLLWERLGRFLWAAGDSLTALEAYEEAERLVPPQPASAARARVLAARGQGLMLLSRHQESRACCEEAIAIARAVGARAEEGHASNTLGCDLGYLGDPAAAVEHLSRAREIAAEVGDLDDLARAYLNLSELLARPLNRLDEALALAREGIELSRRVGLAGDYGVSLQATAADVLFALGRWDEAAALLRDAAEFHPIEMAAIDLHQVSAKLSVGLGAFDAAVEHIEGARRMMTKTVDPQYQAELRAREAELALWLGRPAEARAAALAGLDELVGTDDVWFVGPLLWLALRAEPGGDTGDLVERARALGGTRFTPAVTTAYVRLCEAEVTRGEPGPWQSAAEAWERLGHPFPSTYARWRQAEALLVRRRAKEGADVLVAAHAAAERLGAAPLVHELTLLARRGRVDLALAPAAEPAKPGAHLGLTRREREVLGLLAEGLTNREIGESLFVTEKTAGAHVSNVLAKLRVRSRLEAVNAARRLGLV